MRNLVLLYNILFVFDCSVKGLLICSFVRRFRFLEPFSNWHPRFMRLTVLKIHIGPWKLVPITKIYISWSSKFKSIIDDPQFFDVSLFLGSSSNWFQSFMRLWLHVLVISAFLSIIYSMTSPLPIFRFLRPFSNW